VLGEIQNRECVICIIKKEAGATCLDVRKLEIRRICW
jgi:hypothetical protein